jgi:hypothetical protein
MGSPIEDYALLGDTQTAALVGRDGSIDWLCLPRFDSAACFAALLGDEDNGRWVIAPRERVRAARRRYRGDTLVLETDVDTAEGSIRVVDFMPPRNGAAHVVRLVEGIRGARADGATAPLRLRADPAVASPPRRRLRRGRRSRQCLVPQLRSGPPRELPHAG